MYRAVPQFEVCSMASVGVTSNTYTSHSCGGNSLLEPLLLAPLVLLEPLLPPSAAAGVVDCKSKSRLMPKSPSLHCKLCVSIKLVGFTSPAQNHQNRHIK
jgi:hypothetical protein